MHYKEVEATPQKEAWGTEAAGPNPLDEGVWFWTSYTAVKKKNGSQKTNSIKV